MYELLQGIKLIPVLRKIPYTTSQKLIEALVNGGVQAIEITLDTDKALEIITENRSKLKDDILIGAGTVLSLDDCKKAIAAGAQFIVSPLFNHAVVQYAVNKKIPVIPGVMTPTEIYAAYSAGAQMVKVFPASSVGANFIKNVKGPLDFISIMATGGITLETVQDYFDAGADAVGAGSDLLNKKWIVDGNWQVIESATKEWLEKIG
ncbi:bifunctional 4-hydroxy-2-oxoglutarate aldolase/2-dehydro-3-deoxy-phosphogluconate aldolase [Kurthia sibirica]|uniref:2-dehydro-3-deoxyphosphogluconate aldolase n=1 Tax=Kurthia sibirica TaxID=202750 RepID=A0A2U3AI17_9BACL|nr:bifunctional 4-hydroxy-2-oxoglutarate aldolase/2-dehydro-3-deoxy-phosphogluconate aldolase [Kurthia sibirica]PWI24188.1 2-dehydro-3-deoxyphosphogluconate aldolase [Kurthia sibirica]